MHIKLLCPPYIYFYLCKVETLIIKIYLVRWLLKHDLLILIAIKWLENIFIGLIFLISHPYVNKRVGAEV